MDPGRNRMEPLTDGLKEKLDALYGKEGEKPVFSLGEIIELRGYRWRVSKIGRKGFTLKGIGPNVPTRQQVE